MGADRIDVVSRDFVVTTGTTSYELGVKFRPLFVAIPGAGVMHDDTFAGGGECHQGLSIFWGIEKFSIYADQRHIGFAGSERFGGLVTVFRVVHAEARGLEECAIGAAVKFAKLVRAAAADHEHAGFAGLPDNGFYFRQRGVTRATGFGFGIGCGLFGGGRGFGAGGDVADEIAQARLAQGIEAFRHQRAAGVFTFGDVAGFDFGVPALVANGQTGSGLPDDHTRVGLALFGRDIPLPVVGFDGAIGIHDGLQ